MPSLWTCIFHRPFIDLSASPSTLKPIPISAPNQLLLLLKVSGWGGPLLSFILYISFGLFYYFDSLIHKAVSCGSQNPWSPVCTIGTSVPAESTLMWTLVFMRLAISFSWLNHNLPPLPFSHEFIYLVHIILIFFSAQVLYHLPTEILHCENFIPFSILAGLCRLIVLLPGPTSYFLVKNMQLLGPEVLLLLWYYICIHRGHWPQL